MNTTQEKAIQPEQIVARARELWQTAGSPEGRDLEFWLAAEQELRRDQIDVKQTQQGEAENPPRATPGGLPVKKGETVAPAKRAWRAVAAK